MSRIKHTKSSLPNAFDSGSHKTEWTCAAKLAEWINEIARDKKIPIGIAEVETKTFDSRKRSDIVIYETPQHAAVLCVIECKQPFWDVFNEELKDDARAKGNKRKALYFGTCNFKKLIWWSTEKANNPTLTEEQQILEKYSLSEIENLDEIENVRFREPIRRALEKFVWKLFAVHTGKEPIPRIAIDEHLIDRIHEKIRVLAYFYTDIIRDLFHKDTRFAKTLKHWFDEQMWDFQGTRNDFDRAARQTAYLLVNKILFYDVLQSKRPKDLSLLDIPASLMQSSILQKMLKMYFDEVLKIDYETVFTTDFIDSIAFPDDEEVVKQIKDLIFVLNRYKFDTIGYDILGRIFERLIPQGERHTLGQYFTSADVVDLILRFCSQKEDDKLLDPSCGAGTFLVRAYQHKKLMNQYLKHEDILENLWGNDIAKFPAHLSTINLAINDLGVLKNYPNILQSDFFALQLGPEGFDNDKWRTRRAKALGINEREITYPRYFDAIVGNPPYTRQEEIEATGVEKAKLIASALKLGDKKIANLSKRAGIHAYFFVHGTKFLKEGGHFGFIVANSWLDVDYGKGLQEFFLLHYKIIAIIESKVERWFVDADINTCIVILEKCSNENARMNNLARFVYLKKPLRHFIPAAENEWSKQVERNVEIDKLIKTVLAHSNFYENNNLRVFPVSQQDLWNEGTEDNILIPNTLNEPGDNGLGNFKGAKWGKYLRAPRIFFTLLEKAKNKLVPLRQVAEVRRGFTTGANDFFYLTEEEIKRKRIEKEFWMHKDKNGNWKPNYVIKSPKECKAIIVQPEDLKFRVLLIHKEKSKLRGKNVFQYILTGERNEYHKRPTCAGRKRWYDLGKTTPYGFLHPMIHFERQIIATNLHDVYVDHNLFEVKPFNKEAINVISAFFNSSVSILMKELGGRVNLGEGALKTEGVDIERLLSIHPERIPQKSFDSLNEWFIQNQNFSFQSVFDEIGSQTVTEVSISKVKPSRRELDKIIMEDILGLTDAEQLEVYQAVVDLVKSRVEKARSVEKNNTQVEGIDMELATIDAMNELKNILQ